MITYDYLCPANSEVVPVRHSMKERLATWGEVCAKAERELGSTPADAPVERIISGGMLAVTSRPACSTPAPTMGRCCGGGCHSH